MSTDPDVTRVVRSWLEMGATALPDRVLDQVLDQVPATPQRRLWWPARRLNEMNTPLKLALAAAVAVVFVAAIALPVMTGAGGVGGSPAILPPTAVPTLIPTPTAVGPTPGVNPTAGPTAVGPTPSPVAVDHGWPGSRENPAGRYSWDPDLLGHVFGQRAPKHSVSSWMHKPDSHIEVRMSGFDTEYGPGPTATTVGGYDATYQEPVVNSDDPDAGKRWVWITDIDGKRVTIIVDSGHDASVADLAEARAVIDSIRVEPTDSKSGFKLTFDLLAGWDSA